MSQTQIELNRGLAQMLKGGVIIMDVTTPEQAKIAEETGRRPAKQALTRKLKLIIVRLVYK